MQKSQRLGRTSPQHRRQRSLTDRTSTIRHNNSELFSHRRLQTYQHHESLHIPFLYMPDPSNAWIRQNKNERSGRTNNLGGCASKHPTIFWETSIDHSIGTHRAIVANENRAETFYAGTEVTIAAYDSRKARGLIRRVKTRRTTDVDPRVYSAV